MVKTIRSYFCWVLCTLLLTCIVGFGSETHIVFSANDVATLPGVLQRLSNGDEVASDIEDSVVISNGRPGINMVLKSPAEQSSVKMAGTCLAVGYALPEFKELRFDLEVYLTSRRYVNALYLIVEDAQGEQYRLEFSLVDVKNGWSTISTYLHVEQPVMANLLNPSPNYGGKLEHPCRIVELGIDGACNDVGTLVVGGLSYEILKGVVSPELVLGNNGGLPVLAKSDREQLAICVHNTSGEDNQGILSWCVYDGENTLLDKGRQVFDTPSGTNKFVSLKGVEKFGVYHVYSSFYNLTDNGRKTAKTWSFVYMDSGNMAPESTENLSGNHCVFGVSEKIFTHSAAEYARDAALCRYCGISLLRAIATSGDFARRTSFSKDAAISNACIKNLDGYLNVFGKYGISTVFSLNGISGIDLDDWGQWMKNFAEYYAWRLTAIEVPGAEALGSAEADGTQKMTLEKYAKMSEITRRYCQPNGIMTFTGGMLGEEVPVSKVGYSNLLKDVLLNKQYDGIGLHIGADELSIPRKLSVWSKVKDSHPVMLCDVSTACKTSAYCQATDFFRKAMQALMGGAQAFFWYPLRDIEVADDNASKNEGGGLLTSDGIPKAQFVVCNFICREFASAKYLRSQSGLRDCTCHWFDDGAGNLLLVLMKREGADGRIPLRLSGISNNALAWVSDIFGNVGELGVRNGFISVVLDEVPLVVKLSGCGEDVIHVSQVMSPIYDLPVVNGETSVLVLPFVNQNPDKALMYDIEIELPEGLILAEELPTSIIIGADSVKMLPIKVSAAKNYVSNATMRKNLRLKLGMNQVWKMEIEYLVPNERRVAKAAYAQEPEFSLCDDESRNLLKDAAVSDVSMGYSDENISGDVWLKTGNVNNFKYLWIKAEITDDMHYGIAKKIALSEDGIGNHYGDSVVFVLNSAEQNAIWKIRLSDNGLGLGEYHIISAPEKFLEGHQSSLRNMKCSVERQGKKTIYELGIPANLLGLDNDSVKQNFSFSVRLNDDDGSGVTEYRCLTGGIDDKCDDPRLFVKMCL